jgi:hypothetical protein
MMRILPALLVLFCLPLAAQTAKVIPLSSADSAERKTLEDQRTAIEQKIKDFDARVQKQYTTVLEGDKDSSGSFADYSGIGVTGIVHGCGMILSTDPAAEKAYNVCQRELEAERAKNPPPPQLMYRRGWTNGFEYTEDFKYIVPRQSSGNGNIIPYQWSCPPGGSWVSPVTTTLTYDDPPLSWTTPYPITGTYK